MKKKSMLAQSGSLGTVIAVCSQQACFTVSSEAESNSMRQRKVLIYTEGFFFTISSFSILSLRFLIQFSLSWSLSLPLPLSLSLSLSFGRDRSVLGGRSALSGLQTLLFTLAAAAILPDLEHTEGSLGAKRRPPLPSNQTGPKVTRGQPGSTRRLGGALMYLN